MTSLGVGIYLGGNLIWATIISMILAGIGFPIVWGILGGSMPRSGGEYIYNSRIIHPIVGVGESFGNAFIWLLWIYVLAPWLADPGMVMMSQFMDWTWLYDPETGNILGLSYEWGSFVIATIANIIAFLFVVFGIKWFARIQKVVMIFGIGGCIVLLAAISMYSQAEFKEGWNAIAATYGSLDYDAFLAAASEAAESPMPTTWNWSDTLGVMVAGSWLFAYSYCITFIAGEVKRPDKTIILSNLFAILVPGAFMLWASVALYNMVPFDFFSATQFADNAGVTDVIEGYTVPWSTNFLGLLAMVNQNKLLMFIAVLSFLAFDLWWVALSYLAFPRIIFAWGMDRMGPKWFTDINPRFASPVKNHVLCFVLGQILIAIYVFNINETMQGLAITALEIFSVFGVTAIAALLFPYVKKARGIWDASPYKTWKILGIPMITIGAIVNLVYLGILSYYFFFMPDPAKRLEGFTGTTAAIIAITWALGIAWYFFWTWRNKKVGVDSSMTYGELPPE